MKIITVVGVKKSGKTTVVVEILKELKRRNYRTGTVKTVDCPGFSLDMPGSNSDLHKKAGADYVCIRNRNRMDILGLLSDENRIYPFFDLDYLILEGDYELCVPRIICAHQKDEIEERMTEDTIAIAGVISECQSKYGNLPIFDVRKSAKNLVDYLERSVSDVVFPMKKRPMLQAAIGYHKERDNCRQFSKMMPHIFLTGEKGIGKSTVLRKVRQKLNINEIGFVTIPFEIEERKAGYYMHSLTEIDGVHNDVPICIRVEEHTMVPIPETFRRLGGEILKAAEQHNGIVIMDEIGKAESNVPEFQSGVIHALDECCCILGVLQKGSPLYGPIAAHPKVRVYSVTKENRDQLPKQILNELISFA